MNTCEFQWSRLDAFTSRQWHDVLAAREAVFVVEQECAYQEADEFDLAAFHCTGYIGRQIAAYLRLLPPGTRFPEPSIGRVLTTQPFRGRGLAREIFERGLERAAIEFPGCIVRINAQSYLVPFYRSFGFETVSAEYDEDGAPHVVMLRKPNGSH